MIMMMAVAPLSMKICGLEAEVPFVVQWHMFAMFAIASLFAGQLLARFGNLNVILLGFGLFFWRYCCGAIWRHAD